MTPMSARDRILDAFEALLTTEGERAATLDAVVTRDITQPGTYLGNPARLSRAFSTTPGDDEA